MTSRSSCDKLAASRIYTLRFLPEYNVSLFDIVIEHKPRDLADVRAIPTFEYTGPLTGAGHPHLRSNDSRGKTLRANTENVLVRIHHRENARRFPPRHFLLRHLTPLYFVR